MYTVPNKSTHKMLPSRTMARRFPPSALSATIDYPGQHDFVVAASDGVRFNLSRTMLAATSGFFADMFTLGEPSAPAQPLEEQTVNAHESHIVLDALFAISYSHPEKPKPRIETFTQIAELIRVAEKYYMHHALDYLSSYLTLPRIQGTTDSQPFTVTHPLATLSLSLTHGFNIPARLALKEVANAADSIWDTAFDDAELDGFTLDFRTLKKIYRMHKSRIDTYRAFIQGLKPCSNRAYAYCTNAPNNWKLDLLKKIEEGPNLTAFNVIFCKGGTCAGCGQNLMTLNLDAFTTFITSQAAEESRLPELR